MCIYLRDYESVFKSLHADDLVWVNPRFADVVRTWEEASESKQFRTKDLIDPTQGAAGSRHYELEHEVRPLTHLCNPLGRTKVEADRIGRRIHLQRLAGKTGPQANV